jgi:hypothetical protein
MGPVVNLKILVHQPHVGLIHESGALKGVPGTFAVQMAVREAAKLIVNQRDQSAKGFSISLSPVCEKLGHLIGDS